MKISVITVTLNNGELIKDTIHSVMSQNYPDIEYIIIDGGSTDGSEKIISEAAEKYGDKIKCITVPANGVYHAINCGIKMATGDIIGLLHGNDKFTSPDVLSLIASAFQDKNCMLTFGDVYYVNNQSKKVTRKYSSSKFTAADLQCLFAPPHPTLYVRRDVYEKYGLYKENYVTAADFEYIVRLIAKEKLPYKYIPEYMVEMTDGGMSTTLYNRLFTNPKEKIRGLRENGISVSISGIIHRYISLILSLIKT